MAKLNPHIGFGGQCREAMNFYKKCLGGGELSLFTVKESPIAAQCAPDMQDMIMHASLTKDEMVIMGSDMQRPDFVKGNNVTIMVNCDSEEEINTLFKNFSEGSKITDPLQKQFWGAMFGAMEDKYGITWMFNYQIEKM